jgi:hypothetical protein
MKSMLELNVVTLVEVGYNVEMIFFFFMREIFLIGFNIIKNKHAIIIKYIYDKLKFIISI